ncbi:MAG: ankyrin repeat domain-containing protein [Candidatus Ozemobacteraceae bacterium]
MRKRAFRNNVIAHFRACFIGIFIALALSVPTYGNPLHISIKSLDWKLFSEIIERDFSGCNASDSDGVFPLHYAAGLGCIQMVAALLKNGADPRLTDSQGNSALHWAVNIQPLCTVVVQPNEMKLCNLDVVQMLASAGVDVDARNNAGETPLHIAARQGTFGMVKLLTERRGNPNLQNSSGSSPLHLATGKFAAIVAGVLLYAGADPLLKNQEGKTPVDVAKEVNLPELLMVYERFFSKK